MTSLHPPPLAAPTRRRALRPVALAALMALAIALSVLAGVSVGSTGWQSLPRALGWLGPGDGAGVDALAAQIIWDIRLPRSLGACVAGALLGLAGAVAQGLFRNPLADPYLLGSASGASLGVALALAAWGGSPFAVTLAARLGLTGAAFVGSALAVGLTLVLAKGVHHGLRLLLAGVIVGVVLGALSSLVLLTRPDIMQAMQSFLLGSTAFVGWNALGVMALVLLPCWALAWALARALDALSLGEATAQTLGLRLNAMRAALVGVLALATGAAVAQTGLVAFVGLAAPHLVRSLAPLRHGALLTLSALMGALLLGAADVLARALVAPQELPVGVLTAVLGGSYLLWLMHQGRGMGGGGSGGSGEGQRTL